MRITIRRIGNSKGMIIPAALLTQLGLDTEAEASIVDGALVIRAPAKHARAGWAEASKKLAMADDDGLVLPEFSNRDDAALTW